MRIIPCDQGSAEWVKARSGIPTASAFHRIVTPGKGAPSAQAKGYAYEMVAERLLAVSMDESISDYMQRGKDMEEQARSWYEFEREVDVAEVGFCVRDDGSAGCSPDGLVGDDGGIEIKCPKPDVHIGYLLEGVPDKYRCQIQGSLWITERKWWDFISYHPSLTPALIRVERDEEFIGKLAEAVAAVAAHVADAEARLREMGVIKEAA